MQVVLTKEQKAVLQKNLAFTSRQKSGERSLESLKNEVTQKLFELMFNEYGRTTDRSRIAHGFVAVQKQYRVHLSNKAWQYLCGNKFQLVKDYIVYCKKFHRYE
jgi:hypothetical protein